MLCGVVAAITRTSPIGLVADVKQLQMGDGSIYQNTDISFRCRYVVSYSIVEVNIEMFDIIAIVCFCDF